MSAEATAAEIKARLGFAAITPSPEPIRIYVACLAAYNNGHLHGAWIDATQGESHIWEQTRAMLKASPIEVAEEWAIHDYEGFEGASLSEYTAFKSVAERAEFIEEHGALGGAILADCYCDVSEAARYLEHYQGEYESLADYARESTESSGPDIPENLAPYIDYERMGDDLRLSGDITFLRASPNRLHIFAGL